MPPPPPLPPSSPIETAFARRPQSIRTIATRRWRRQRRRERKQAKHCRGGRSLARYVGHVVAVRAEDASRRLGGQTRPGDGGRSSERAAKSDPTWPTFPGLWSRDRQSAPDRPRRQRDYRAFVVTRRDTREVCVNPEAGEEGRALFRWLLRRGRGRRRLP